MIIRWKCDHFQGSSFVFGWNSFSGFHFHGYIFPMFATVSVEQEDKLQFFVRDSLIFPLAFTHWSAKHKHEREKKMRNKKGRNQIKRVRERNMGRKEKVGRN